MKIEVKVHPKAKREKVLKGNPWQVWVKEAPEKGKANERLREIVAEEMGVSKSRVKIVKGISSRFKILEVNDD